MNDLDILLETTPTKKELKQANPEIPIAKIEETGKKSSDKRDSLTPYTNLGIYPEDKNLPPYEFSKLGNTEYTDHYTQSNFLQTVTARGLSKTYINYLSLELNQEKKQKIMNRIAILKKIIDYEKNTPSFKSSSPIPPTPTLTPKTISKRPRNPTITSLVPGFQVTFPDFGAPYPINTSPTDFPPPPPGPSSKKPKFPAG